MKRLAYLLTTIAAGLRSFDDLVDENDRLAASNETLRARVIEQQARIDQLEAEKAADQVTFVPILPAPDHRSRIGWGNR